MSAAVSGARKASSSVTTSAARASSSPEGPSGTSANFQAYLQAASGGAWDKGTGKIFAGGVGTGAHGNQGTAAEVKNTEGAISYNEYSFALQQNLFAAQIKTSASRKSLRPVRIGADTVGKTISNAKIIGISVDPVESHVKWKGDIQKATGHAVNYPMIGDKDLKVAKLYDMLPASAGDTSEGRTPADNATVRSVFVIGPDKKIKLILTYPMSTGRNFQEILRAIDSIQLTAKFPVSTPADWKPGEDVVIAGSVSDEDAVKRFGAFETILPYIRKAKQPSA